MNNLITRGITGILFVGVILGAIFWSPHAAAVIFTIFMLLGVIEFFQLFKKHPRAEPSLIMGIVTALILIGGFVFMKYHLIYHVQSGAQLISIALLCLPAILFLTVLIELWRKKEHPILNVGVSILGFLYVVIPFLLLIILNYVGFGKFPLVAGMFLLIWTNDTFAYLTGRLIGKTKLIERISPNKTWEGTIGGIVFTIIVGITIGYFTENMSFWVGSAIIVAPTAILGDLIESMFKRTLNLKDSGTILPGHGGILDRFDATLFTVPFFLAWMVLYDLFF
jgi:phosphatidate cytidylyltransferase